VIAGAVLCGGRSRRMGTDKAVVEVAGVPMVARVADALAVAGCDPVLLVGGDPAHVGGLGWRLIADRYPGEGPAGGVVTALEAFTAGGRAERVIVAACDLPHLDAATVVAVGAALDGCDAAVAVTDRWQLSLTGWRGSAATAVRQAWRDGARSLRELVAAVDHAEVAVAPGALRNVNTPEEWSAAERVTR
jgi:molybdopterin-guanine dinucleotide biosynthesis protein A